MRISAAARKQQLIDATVRLMRRKGVGALTLRAIAEEAGASVATVHYCFEDKNELLRAAVDRWLQSMVSDLTPDKAEQCDLGTALRRIGSSFWDLLEADPDDVLAQLEVVTWAVRTKSEAHLAKPIYERYESELAAGFTRIVEQSGERLAMSPESLARSLLVLIDGCSFQGVADPKAKHHRALFGQLLDGLLHVAVQSETPVSTRPTSA